MKNKLYLTLASVSIALFGMTVKTNAQSSCSITMVANPMIVCVGDSSVLTASVQFNGTGGYSFDFNNSSLPSGWTFTGTPSFGTTPSCAAPSLDNSAFLWSSSSSVAPIVETGDLDVSSGGNINYEFRFAPNSGSSPCETADQYNEGVALEYSTNGGGTWSLIVYHCSVPSGGPWDFVGGYSQTLLTVPTATTPGNGNGSTGIYDVWAPYVIPIPPGAQTTSTRFRWRQPNSSGSCCDNWGLDNITVNAGASSYYQWSTGSQSMNQNSVTVYNLQATDTTIVVYVTDTVSNTTCFDSLTIQVQPLPVIDMTYNSPICAGDQVTFDASQTTPQGQIASFQYDLDNNGTYEYSLADSIHTFSYYVIAGSYTFNFRATNDGGCSADTTMQVQVYANPSLNLLANPVEVCLGAPINLLAQGNVINPPSLPSTLDDFDWDFQGNGTIDTTDHPSGNNSAITYVYDTPGTYEAFVTVTTSGNCSSVDSIQIIVNDLPVAGFTADTVCFGNQSSLMDTTIFAAPPTNPTYAWTVTNTSGYNYTGSTTDVMMSFPDTGTYTAVLIVVADGGCSDTAQHVFMVYPNPQANFSYNTECFQKNVFFDQTTGGTKPYVLEWDLDNDGNPDEYLPIFEHKFSDSNDVYVTLAVTDSNGCVSDTAILVNVKGGVNSPQMPDVMSLTSQYGNDKYDFQQFAPGFNDCINYTLTIYNRWGILVYEAVNDVTSPDLNCSGCFTGKTKTGSTLTSGTYYYVLKGNNEEGTNEIVRNGTITIFD